MEVKDECLDFFNKRWTEDQVQTLAEIVLKHIRNKSTLINASKEAAETLHKTEEECNNHWCNHVKDEYSQAIIHAMKV